MKKSIVSTAYHEAGHAVAYILTNKRFKYVTIVPTKSKDAYEPGSLGHIIPISTKITRD